MAASPRYRSGFCNTLPEFCVSVFLGRSCVELLEIKRGAWPLEKVKAEAERLFQLAEEAYVRSPLPTEPERDRAEKLCVKIIGEYHGLNVG